ncbi:YlqD family protein [Barrientosiimonas marina]|uniref:YlqD family protein n=1 Tax=Lentibacillus kimchii TaxID=1542911 RepID=A0ABW2URX2_9BACI
MQIIKKVQVKQIITEKSKAKLRNNFYDQKMRLEQECQQLKFEQRKQENKHTMSKQELSQRFQKEIEKRQEKMESVDFKSEQLAILEMGSEITEKEVDALVEVDVGSHWDDVMKAAVIVIEDDVVVRIENSR